MDYLPAPIPEHSAMRSSSFPKSSGPAPLRGLRVATPALVLVTLTLVPPAASLAQRPTGFTANDALEVVSTQVGDLSADGRWLVVTASNRRDQLSVDFRR